ncbi:hypothetical protein [Rhizobium sp. CECT 9324]|uniref:phage nozzle protein n=1 Tax=Rhizobium sp. CECT 9324 TaxID=2845820 RepID=UPI001E38420A|nr:hypothetical protein [Rhizobium sp. CECT 9324]CAH0343718.1 hypothetical protein RHI9324_05455 [Rhizobium sp. CECT 9324]
MAIESATHPSLIQGISQQSDFSRGTASAEDQENCLNEVLDGVVSRMGSKVVAAFSASYADPFVHEFRHSDTEKYMVLIENGQLRIINRAVVPAVEATITGDISSYLSQSGVARKAFQAMTVGDTTFLLNRQKIVAMGAARSAARSSQGCAFIRAGGYLVTYTMSVVVGGAVYSTSYMTPDNSVGSNAQFIVTDQIAEQFRASFTNTIFPQIAAAGRGSFTVERYGSTLVFGANVPFNLRSTDGAGDTHIRSFVDDVKSIAELPQKCKPGYTVMVSPNGAAKGERYFLQYVGDIDNGRWEEIVKWDTVLGLNAATMPHLLVLTGPNQFEVKQATWGTRVAGDGQYTSQNPSYVGYPIRSIQFISGRLAAVSEFNMTLSRSRNAFVFFPDTSQTTLDTAPIDYDISNGSSTAIEYGVLAGGRLQFWGDGQQTYLDSGQDAIREDTTEVLPVSNYNYDGETPPRPIGMSSILFGSSVGRWSRAMEIFLRNGLPQGEVAITSHVPKLLDGKIRCIAASEVSGKAFFLTTRRLTTAYLYQWYNQGTDRVQSAWNRWVFPVPGSIIWAGIDGDTAHFLLQWNGVMTLETVRLDSQGDEEEELFPLRLDHRVDETRGVFSDDHFLVTLPYPVPEDKRHLFQAYERLDILNFSQRGRRLQSEWVSATTVKVFSDDSSRKFFFGTVPVARRKPSRFYARDRNDSPIVHEKLLIRDLKTSHKDTVTYDVILRKQDGTSTTQTFNGRIIGDPTIVNNQVPVKTGNFKATIGTESEEADIELVNPTPFPCVWTAHKYHYEVTVKA